MVPLAHFVFPLFTRLMARPGIVALFVFGFIKGRFTTNHPFRSAVQTILVGSLAASAAFAMAKLVG